MLKVGIIIGSTRPNRVGAAVAQWVLEQAKEHRAAEFELIDLLDFNLPLLDEPVSPAMSTQYQHAHTKKWSAKIASLDAFIFVSPEYNHGTSAALKNALDFLYHEWNDKVAAFVAYGMAGGTRAVEQLRLNLAELQMATVRNQLALSLRTDFEQFKIFKPARYQEQGLKSVIEQLIRWGEALQQLRLKESEMSTRSVGDAGQISAH
jgi:NAD(P)H-dependent FMN reductase